jgi:acyl carrier protein
MSATGPTMNRAEIEAFWTKLTSRPRLSESAHISVEREYLLAVVALARRAAEAETIPPEAGGGFREKTIDAQSQACSPNAGALDRTSIVSTLDKVFAKVFRRPIALRDSLVAADVEGWDSMTNIRLLDAIEREFGITFSVNEVVHITSVGSIVELIHAKTSGR